MFFSDFLGTNLQDGLTWLTYFLFGIEDELLSENFIRGIVTFLLNHLLFIFISYVVWYFMKYFTEKEKNLKLENDWIIQSQLCHAFQ